jgi:hypothetical protein
MGLGHFLSCQTSPLGPSFPLCATHQWTRVTAHSGRPFFWCGWRVGPPRRISLRLALLARWLWHVGPGCQGCLPRGLRVKLEPRSHHRLLAPEPAKSAVDLAAAPLGLCCSL